MRRTSRPRVFSVRPHTTNVGNDVIALGTEALLELAWGEPVDVVSLPSAGAPRGAKPAGLGARNVYEANQLADAVIAGGGNVLENGALLVEPTALAALQPPLGLVGFSSGRVRGVDGQLHPRTDGVAPAAARALCARADILLARDRATAALLADLDIADATVAGCPSLLLGRASRPLPAPDPSVRGAALLSVRHPRLMSVPYAEQGRVHRDVEDLTAVLGERYGHVILLCHDYQDLAFAAQFPDTEARYTEDPLALLGWLRGCAVAAGYRLHGFLAAVAVGAQAVHVSYDERGTSMIETLGLEAYDVPMAQSPRLAAAVADRLGDVDGIPPATAAAPTIERLTGELVHGVRTLAQAAAGRRAARTEVPR